MKKTNMDNLLPDASIETLRLWLAEHGRSEKSCWVVVSLTPKPDTLLYLDAVEEALCRGWIDGVKRKISDTELAQRLSPRSARSSWTELNKERVRRLERLGRMTDEGRQVLPDLGPDSFRIDPEIERRLREDAQTYENFMAFPGLYRRVRVDNVQNCRNQPELFESRLDKFIFNTQAGKMYGQWNDNGRLWGEGKTDEV